MLNRYKLANPISLIHNNTYNVAPYVRYDLAADD